LNQGGAKEVANATFQTEDVMEDGIFPLDSVKGPPRSPLLFGLKEKSSTDAGELVQPIPAAFGRSRLTSIFGTAGQGECRQIFK